MNYQQIIDRHAERCDGAEYEMIIRALEKIKGVPGMILEIGTRKGGSMQIIIDALLENEDYDRNVISVDPYGNIPYNSGNQYGVTRFDYTNEMKKEAMATLFSYVQGKRVNFVPFCMSSGEFISRFTHDVSIYQNEPDLMQRYAFAFLDGQHDTQSVLAECFFLANRSVLGSRIVIDNIDFFDCERVERYMKNERFEIEEKGTSKITFVCKH